MTSYMSTVMLLCSSNIPRYFIILHISVIFTGGGGVRRVEQILAETILASPHMWTYQHLCVAHAHYIDDVSSNEF